jgi:DNA-binding NtrC family response regulator
VVPIYLPPLRERGARTSLRWWVISSRIYNEQNDRYVTHIDPSPRGTAELSLAGQRARAAELVEHAVVMATGDELAYDLLPAVVRGEPEPTALAGTKLDFESLCQQLVVEGLQTADAKANNLHARIVDRVEREVLAQVLSQCEGVQIKAASRLGINRNTLHKKIKDYGLDS